MSKADAFTLFPMSNTNSLNGKAFLLVRIPASLRHSLSPASQLHFLLTHSERHLSGHNHITDSPKDTHVLKHTFDLHFSLQTFVLQVSFSTHVARITCGLLHNFYPCRSGFTFFLVTILHKQTSRERLSRRTVNRVDGGSITPAAVSKLNQFRSPHIACVSRKRH